MSAIFSLAQLSASDYQFARNADQNLIYEATQMYITRKLADVAASANVFVSGRTETAKERYQLPGTGLMSPRADGVRGAAVRATGSWDVAYTLEDYSEQIAATDVEYAYMTPAEYQRNVDTILVRYANRYRREMLYHLFNNASKSFTDPRLGSLSVVPLANGDSVVYPPVLGTTTEATDDHYLESNYAATAISDTNNPFETVRDELEEHFGAMTGGENIVAFINNDERSVVEALTDFVPVPDQYIRVGDNVDVPQALPSVPGRILGRCSGVWVVEWRWVPDNYLLAVHLEAEPPIKERVDPAETGLPRGLSMMPVDERYPIESAEWRARFGMGVANRLNGVVMEFGTGGTYSIPSDYS